MDRTAAGDLLREWRQRRNVSQLDLAHRAGVSPRHVSFIETGRSRASSAMLLRLCDHLAVPLREQNRLLVASGHAPAHPEHALDEPSMSEINAALEAILAGHLPYPAVVIDRGWDMVAANDAAYAFLQGVASHLLEPPINVIRLSLHPDGMAARIVNLDEWRGHLRHRLEQEYAASGDARLAELLEFVASSGFGVETRAELAPRPPIPGAAPLVVPLRLRAGDHVLSFISTTTVFGTPLEVTLSELAIEAFYPADEETRAALHG